MISRIGHKIFGSGVRRNIHSYHEVGLNLRKAMIPTPLEIYISTAKFSALISGVVGLIIGIFLSRIARIPELPFYIPEPFYSIWMAYRSTVLSILIIVTVSLSLYYLTYLAFIVYPSIVVSNRKSKIDSTLHHAIAFMHALSIGGMDIYRIIKRLSERRDVYGEVSREVSRIVRDVEYAGMDLRSALSNAVELSPSENYKEFLHGLITVIDSGGDVRMYLEERVEHFFEKARQSQRTFLDLLGLMAESYITALVAAPLFLLIVEIVMIMMGQGDELIVYLIIYFIIPIGSIVFACIVKMISPMKEMEAPEIGERRDLKSLGRMIIVYRIKKIVRNPIEVFRRNPYYTFLISLPLGLLFSIYGFTVVGFKPDINWFFSFDDYMFVSIVITILPFSIFHELKNRRIKRYLRYMPIFFNRLASINESGVPLYRAISIIAKTDTSPLRYEIRRMKIDIDWGMDLERAFMRFANRIKVFDVTRIVAMLNEAMKSTGDLTSVLMISAREASKSELLRRERYHSMMMYTIIVYIAFFVFIGIIQIISSMFLKTFTVTATPVISKINVDLYRNLLMHGAIFQGIFGGMVAGVMGEGSVSSGLKHSIAMLILAYAIFNFLH